MKIAIYTIQSMNYGNRLQNYAVKLVLEGLNNDVYTLRTVSKKEQIEEFLLTKPQFKKFKWLIPSLMWVSKKIKFLTKRDANHYFEVFNSNIPMARDYISYSDYSLGNYDAIVVGSDQVWNTSFNFISNNAFLPFYHSKKIAFSASFGVNSISNDQKIAKCLKDFKALSVREEAGAKIIKELTGRKAEILVDPTMLLTQDEWRRVSKKPKGAEEGYILTYFLSPKCSAAEKCLAQVRGNKRVYELLNNNDQVTKSVGPSEFLWLFDHAELVLTDSFHACVFSFLFNKPFLVYDRNWNEGNMNSRLETLLKKFYIERKYANSSLKNDIWEHDYTKGYQQLELERQKAIKFLEKALED